MPVLLSAAVWPGAGQIRNKEVLKGALLAAWTLVLLGVLFYRVLGDLWPLVVEPPDASVLVPKVTAAVTQALEGHSGLVALLGVVWVYSILDALFVARTRTARPS